jgi:hypothetical protein
MNLLALPLDGSLSRGIAILWPGSKGAVHKKHRPIEIRISNFIFFFLNPHSAINNPQLRTPARLGNEAAVMIFGHGALASRSGRAWNSILLSPSSREEKAGKDGFGIDERGGLYIYFKFISKLLSGGR